MQKRMLLLLTALSSTISIVNADDITTTMFSGQNIQKDTRCPQNEMSIFKDLNLTNEQISQIKLFRQQMRVKVGDDSREHLFIKYVQNGVFDKKGYIASSNQKALQKTDAMAAYFEKIYNILTPEQKVKLKNKISEK